MVRKSKLEKQQLQPTRRSARIQARTASANAVVQDTATIVGLITTHPIKFVCL